MQLRLSYSPTPENAPRFAADVTTSAREVSGVDLDYTEASIEKVDQIIDGFRREGVSSEKVGETLFGFGCYVGEVLRLSSRGPMGSRSQHAHGVVWRSRDHHPAGP